MKLKKVATAIAFTGLSYFALGQTEGVAIKSTVSPPDESAMLDVEHASKGVLIPRVSLVSKSSASPVVSPANSLIVYNTATSGVWPNNVDPGFYYWFIPPSGSVWLPEWRRLIDQEPEYGNGGLINIGGIIMWSGDPLHLPYGWQLCDGSLVTSENSPILNQATPDLSGQFIVGYDPGGGQYHVMQKGTAGVKSVAFTDASQLPPHNHDGITQIGGKIGLNGKTSDAGSHTHTVPQHNGRIKSHRGVGDVTNHYRSNSTTNGKRSTLAWLGFDGVHTHQIDGVYNINGELDVDVFPEGKSLPLENRPPYYVLAYIMRVQ